ncbi:NADH-quinone oxidoreductase subunit NuoE [Pontiella agarivorans]|uniref:NADH-quinone oxidoreductase subunit NuoE n=1 Tax=Pontiella agarivorans TaxID=3038953 RepID=A0ABU5N0B3_9BACT|nr:NADH-quinone oxidoreductase subunit NuoE [Pontiella agarivorans]MDZ8119890.1 NADH-quinone oxidoreductase subunit NuoE [Pontiella agarivorans]
MSCKCDIREKVDGMIDRIGTANDLAIPLLQAVQSEFRYIPVEAIEQIAARTEMTETRLYGVATFYSQFRLEPVGEKIIKVCHGTACHVAGAEGVTEALERRLGISDGETTADGRYTLESVACLGCCSLAPVVAVDDDISARVDRGAVVKLIDELEALDG